MCVCVCVCVCVCKETVASTRRLLQCFQLLTTILAIFRGIVNFFLRYSKVVIYFTISVGTRTDVLWNPKVLRNPV